MKVIIPMAGAGHRFVVKGYDDPKPLIKVNNKRIIEYILEMFDANDEVIFICNETHLEKTQMKSMLESLRPNASIRAIPNHRKGPIYTIMPFLDLIKDEEEVLVCYCDNPLLWDRNKFELYISNNNLDGCILTHVGMHPHTLNSTKMAFLKVENELMIEIKEKECYTDDPTQEHASTGVYYFKTGKIMKDCFKETIERNINYAGEYYVTLSYNLLVEKGLRVGYYDTEFVTVFGTPEEVENFEAWQIILKGQQVKNEQQLLDCYRYWTRYNGHKTPEVHTKNNEMPKALVDIDETICFYEGPRIYENAKPSFENIKKINKLFDSGWEIVYWTARGSTKPDDEYRLKYLLDLTKKQLKAWGAKYNEIIIGDKKPLFDLVIDDKAKRIEEL